MPRATLLTARPALRRLPTRASLLVQQCLRPLLPAVFAGQRLRRQTTTAAEVLLEQISASRRGECNLLIAFRHPSPRDPLVLADLFWNALPDAARRRGLNRQRPVQLRFLYDRGIPLWAGPLIGWLLQRSGGIAIHRGRLDRPALKQARETLTQGRYPLVVAPEGATNNLSEEMAPLEPGVAQLAFWAATEMEASQDKRDVHVIPVGIRYSWRRPNWRRIDDRLQELEKHLGLNLNSRQNRHERILKIGITLLSALEQLERITPEKNQTLADRIEAYRLHGLQKGEMHFGLRASGTLQERCRRIEQAGWDRIYRENLDQLSPLERSLADWEAREADQQLTHMRLVEHFTSISGHYIKDQPSFDRFAEMVELLEEAIGWIEDKPWNGKPSFGPQRVVVAVAKPIAVRKRLIEYQDNRRRAVQALTSDLNEELEKLMRTKSMPIIS